MLTSWALGPLLFFYLISVELLDFILGVIHFGVITFSASAYYILGVITFLRIASSPELETS